MQRTGQGFCKTLLQLCRNRKPQAGARPCQHPAATRGCSISVKFLMSKPYGHNLADLTFRPAGCNGAMRSYTAKPAGQFRRLLFQKIFCCRVGAHSGAPCRFLSTAFLILWASQSLDGSMSWAIGIETTSRQNNGELDGVAQSHL